MFVTDRRYFDEDPGPDGNPGSGGAATATDDGGGESDLPERQRLQAENNRIRAELNKLKANTRVGQPAPQTPAQTPGSQSQEEIPDIDAMINDIPDETWLDPKEAARAQLRLQDQRAQMISRQEAAAAQRTVETNMAATRRQEMINANVERFRDGREWTQDGDRWQAFAAHMNTIVGNGEAGEITYDQLVAQEKAFRGDEMINEALSEGQGRTLDTISGASRTRTTTGRGAATSINDMGIDEQIAAIGESDDPERTFYQINDEKRRDAILAQLDNEV